MARVNITIGIRSLKPVEVEPGVFMHTYSEYENINATTLEQGFTFNDGQTINPNLVTDTRVSFLMSNDINNRLNRISYIKYLGIMYKTVGIKITRPRVEITLGGVWTENE